jgi:leucyl aminopeptidase
MRRIPFLALTLLPSAPAFGLEPDPRVAEMVASVRAADLLTRVDELVAFGTRRSDQPGGRAAQLHIEGLLGGMGLDEVWVQDFDAGADNVVGVLRGAIRPERLHVLGAHYDSVADKGPAGPAPGADDNASGTAALLEAARAFAQSGLRPAETILFVAFADEETGMGGSTALVAELLAEAPGSVVSDMIAMDVIGYLAPGTELDLSVTSIEFTPEINALISRLGEVAGAYLPTWRFEGGAGCG